MKKKNIVSSIILGFVVLLGIITLLNSCAIINPGQTGVVVNMGAVTGKIFEEGFHFKAPFITSVVSVNNQTQKVEVECNAASKDLQTIKSKVSINYRVDKAASANLYKNVNLGYQATIILPAVPESVKSVTSKYTAEELITKRTEVSDLMKEAVAEKLLPYGIIIEIFNITDFSFSEEFDKAIEAKQTAQQAALKAEQDLTRIKIEAQQQIEQAKAEAEALRIKKEQISDEMLKLEWIKKWDGKLPIVTDGSGNLINIDSILGK